MAEATPIPIILCGKTEFIVVHFILPGESGKLIIPALLAGKPPPSHHETSSIGSANYSQPPRAIVLGGAFEEADIKALRDAAKANQDARNVPWLRQDLTRPAPPVTSPEYPRLMVKRTKEAVLGLEREGKLDGGHGGLEWY
ncbi:hypothetical protein F66182_1166 [Fusarium sp. NRRL 66182]|nr:hypothetical protein F66182_1166 [Fusarium sp. NRRL 66182]